MCSCEESPSPTSERFLSKRRLGWAGLGGIAACAAACAFPAAGLAVGVGVVATGLRLLGSGAALVFGALGFTAVLGALAAAQWWTRRKRARVYHSPAPAAGAPVACTADLRDR